MNNEQTSLAMRVEPRYGPAHELDITARNVRDVDAALPAPNMGIVPGLGALEVNGLGDPSKHLELDSVRVLGQWAPKPASAYLTRDPNGLVYGYGKAYSGDAIVPGTLGDENELNTSR